MGTITDVFGTPLPPALMADFVSANEIQVKSFEAALKFAATVSLEGRIVSAQDLSKAAQDLKLSESGLLGVIRLYQNLIAPFLKEPSGQKFQDELSGLGLESRKAESVWRSLDSNRLLIERLSRDAIRESFGPVLKSIRWRVDNPVSSSEPLGTQPIGVVSMTLESNTEEFDERFEVDLRGLDELIDVLTALRRSLSTSTKVGRRS